MNRKSIGSFPLVPTNTMKNYGKKFLHFKKSCDKIASGLCERRDYGESKIISKTDLRKMQNH